MKRKGNKNDETKTGSCFESRTRKERKLAKMG